MNYVLLDKIVFLNTHPIQYFAPMYQEMARTAAFDFEVWYCTRHGLNDEVDKQFGRAIQWDIPVTEGYPYRFLKNYAPSPSIYTRWGILNLGIFKDILRLPRRSAVVVFGWNNPTYLAAVLFCRLTGRQAFIRCENPFKKEKNRRGLAGVLQRKMLQYLLFPLVSRFLFIGEQNRRFYRHYGVGDSRLTFAPYAVDNDRFRRQADLLAGQKTGLQEELGLPAGKKVILFTGKFIPVKRPLDLIEAFRRIAGATEAILVMVGDGALKDDIQARIREYGLSGRVILPGFVNQTEIPRYYAVADVLVLCSTSETWGLSVNEAMNFNLPVVVSDMVGCSDDLVRDGENGFVFPVGDVEALAEKLQQTLENENWRMSAGQASGEIIAGYSFRTTIENLATLCVAGGRKIPATGSGSLQA